MSNRLAAATSPYLLQHADNPVDWWEWEDAAFEQATQRDVPVLLSVGYATCHWCHVMAHESFEDATTAAYMNDHFVCIKVDREERPDIDRIYMDAVTAVTGRGGWPMTVFLTPGREPIFAGTYFPPTRRGGHPSFMELMEAVASAWMDNRAGVVDQAARIGAAIATAPRASDSSPDLESVHAAIDRLATTYDRVNAGFGGAPKFPQAPTLELLLRTMALDRGEPVATKAESMLIPMLHAMAQGGIRDHLTGGFARYSVDAQWLIPHFEKMLYDNALLARVYLRAWQLTGDGSLLEVARAILDYLDRDMADPTGGLHSAEDADSEGVEGRFAVWTWSELRDVLGEDLDLAASIYGATPEGNFEGSNNLHRSSDLQHVAAEHGFAAAELAERKRTIDTRLRNARSGRVPPQRDDKLVSAWNGLALRAFAEASAILRDDRYLARARSIATFLDTTASPDGELVRSWRSEPGHPGFAEDYAAVAVAMYTMYSVDGDLRWYRHAERRVEALRSRFADPDGGFYSTPDDATGLIARPKNLQDNPTPSDNALAMEALLLHAAYTADATAVDQAEATMRSIAVVASEHPGFAGYGLAVWLTHLHTIKEVAVIGSESTTMTDVVWDAFRPNVALAISEGGDADPPLVVDRPGTIGGIAYVCVNHVCDLPVRDPEELRQRLA